MSLRSANSSSEPLACLSSFAIFWAIATLFHLAFRQFFFHNIWYSALTVTALALIAMPGSIPALLVFAVTQLTVLLRCLPHASNHWLFICFINAELLAAALVVATRRRNTNSLFSSELWSVFAPLARCSLLLLYFFAVLHKLNWDFLNPSTSCASTLYLKLSGKLGFLPNTQVTEELVIWGTIVAESLIPLLLISKRGRWSGIFLSFTLHSFFAVLPQYFNFSSMIFAMLLLFTGSTEITSKSSSASGLSIVRLIQVVILALVLCGTELLPEPAALRIFRLIWVFYVAAVLAYLIWLYSKRSAFKPGQYSIQPLRLCLFPALIILNGLCPYLGLKTETSFAMYSNLRTEGGKFNHLFIPSTFQIFPYQNEMVEIVGSSFSKLRVAAAEHQTINFLDLRAITSRKKSGWVKYIKDGNLVSVQDVSKSAELMKPLPLWQRKLLHFKPINREDPFGCQH